MKTFQEMCGRYDISKSTFSMWLKRNRESIDPNGTHIKKACNKVFFDDFAVAKIDKLRGYELTKNVNSFASLEAEIKRLRNENLKLQEELLILQRKQREIVSIILG